MQYQEKYLAWSDLPLLDTEYDLGPALDITDYGACCYFSPHYSMSKINRNVSNWKMIFHQNLQDLKAKNGESNGLDVLLHAEQFNYAFYKTHGAGFKLALHDHRDKAFMQFSAKLIQMGSETQINIKPSIVCTLKDAIVKFDSHESGC